MGAFEIRNPDFERVVRESFARQRVMATMGAELRRVAAGEVTISLAHADALTQQNGFLHAGVVGTIADSACGYAALTLAPPGTDVLAVEFKISLLRPAGTPRVEARARVLKAGRTLTSVQAEVYGIQDGREELVAVMLSTIIARPAV